MKLLLVRHGATDKHRKPDKYCLINGSEGNIHLKGYSIKTGLDKKVTEELKAKARELAKEFPSIDAIYCSALFRTKETAEGLIEGYKEIGTTIRTGNPFQANSPIPDFRLNERDYGPILSSVAKGLFNDEFYLSVAPENGWLSGVSIEKLKELFPNQCDSIESDNVLDYLKAILTYDGKGLPRVAVITSNSDLTVAGIESTQMMQERLTDFEESVLSIYDPSSTILIGSHGDVMGTWLKKVQEDDVGRYTQRTHELLEERDANPDKIRHGSYRTFGHLEHFVVELS